MANATLCISGFSGEEAVFVQQLFEQANAQLNNRWSKATESDARVLMIDMDSMYGHMTWLKAHNSGKITVGISASNRSETDFPMIRPIALESLVTFLDQLYEQATYEEPTPEPVAPPVATTTGKHPAFAFRTTGRMPAMPALTTAASAAPTSSPTTTGKMPAMPSPPTVQAAPKQSYLSDFLTNGALRGPVKIQLADAPVLALEPTTQRYACAATLKPLQPYLEVLINDSALTNISKDEFDHIAASQGGEQPYQRLAWLCGLLAGRSQLLPGFNPNAKYKLTKWPQIEREYPKHFRVATVMMKGPAGLTDITSQSGASLAEVMDFVNGGLLTGVVVVDGATPVEIDMTRAAAILTRARSA